MPTILSCEICNKYQTINKCNLEKHKIGCEKRHEYYYICDTCNKFSTNDQYLYDDHVIKCLDKYSYIFECEYCNKFKANAESNYNRHIKSCQIKYSDTETTYKKCFACKEEKLLTEFSKDNSRGDGYQYRCKDCLKVWRKDNDEVLKVKKAVYRNVPENKEMKKKMDKDYRNKNKDKLNTYFKNKRESDIQHKYACDLRGQVNRFNVMCMPF